jgi:hypothetical protein
LPLVIAQAETTPMPPFCVADAEQLQWPAVSVEQVVFFHPIPENAPAALEHSTLTDDTDRQAGESGNVIVPVVTVLSVYVVSPFAVHVPVTCSEPVTGTVGHPRLASTTSMSPATVKQDEVTLQVPRTDPPQVEPPGQFWGAAVPPVPVAPPVPPPETGELQLLVATASERVPKPIRPTSVVRMGLIAGRAPFLSRFF